MCVEDGAVALEFDADPCGAGEFEALRHGGVFFEAFEVCGELACVGVPDGGFVWRGGCAVGGAGV